MRISRCIHAISDPHLPSASLTFMKMLYDPDMYFLVEKAMKGGLIREPTGLCISEDADFGSVMHSNQGPAAGFYVTSHVEGALIRAQGDVATMTFASPPSASNIPLLDHLPDEESFSIPNEDDGTITIELDFLGKADFTGTADTF